MTGPADDVQVCYDAVREALNATVLPGTPLARATRAWMTDHALPPSLLIPIAAAATLSRPAVTLSSALGFLLLTMRWLDDLVDRDRDGQLWQTVGDGPAAVLAASALTHAWSCLARDPDVSRDTLVAFGETTAVLAMGEAADAEAKIPDLDTWQRVAWRKTAVGYRFAAWAGAQLTGHETWQREAAEFGSNLGLYLQAQDDISGAFEGDTPDLSRGVSLTLPLVLLQQEMPEARDLFRRRDVHALRHTLHRLDIRQDCERIAATFALDARAALKRAEGPWNSACKGLLPSLCDCAHESIAV